MSEVNYKVTRFDPQMNCASHPSSNHVHSVIFGLQATNPATGSTAYIDERIKLDPCLTPEELNNRAEELCEMWAGTKGWYMHLQKALFKKDMAPRPMPDGYQKPDIDNMSIGDGYKTFVINENNINDDELVKEVFAGALPEEPAVEDSPEEPTEEPTDESTEEPQ